LREFVSMYKEAVIAPPRIFEPRFCLRLAIAG